MSTIDPVFQASEYQQMLLAQLGSDDPADVQRQTPAQWRALIAESGAHLRTRPADGEWSVIELLGHAADAELVVAGRLRWIAAQDEPPLLGYDQDQWVSGSTWTRRAGRWNRFAPERRALSQRRSRQRRA